MANLGSELAKGLPLLTDLIVEETNRTKRAKLKKVYRKLSAELRRLVEKNVRRNTIEYRKATAALAKANAAMRAAKRDLAKVAATITRLSKAADLIGKVAAMAV